MTLFYRLNKDIIAGGIVQTHRPPLDFQNAPGVLLTAEQFYLFAGMESKRGHSGTEFPVSGYLTDPFPAMIPDF